MYGNLVPCYCNSGLSLEVGLSSHWVLIGGWSLITVASHWRFVSHHSGLSLEVGLSSQWSLITGFTVTIPAVDNNNFIHIIRDDI